MDYMAVFDDFQKNLQQQFNFKVKYKNESIFMDILSKLLFFNIDFSKTFTTTIGKTVYFPSKQWVANHPFMASTILAHEICHIQQAKKYSKILYSILYLFPQILSIFSLLAILSIWWINCLWFLVFLVFLLPIPAPFRAKFEFEGYVMSLFMMDQQLRRHKMGELKIFSELSIHALRVDKDQFRGSTYWYMWPFGIMDKFENKIIEIRSGDILNTDEIYGRVKTAYQKAVLTYEL
jgi:hypothetical protein